MKHLVSIWNNHYLSLPDVVECEFSVSNDYLYATFHFSIDEMVVRCYQDPRIAGYAMTARYIIAYGAEWKSTRLIDFVQSRFLVMSERLWRNIAENRDVKVNDVWYNVSPEFPHNLPIGGDILFSAPPLREGNFFDWQSKLRYSATTPLLSDEGKWKADGRQEMKPSKFMMGIKNFYNVWLDGDIVNGTAGGDLAFRRYVELKSESFRPLDKSLIKVSDKPSEIYRLRTDDNSGSLSNSCMRQESSYGCSANAHVYDRMGCKVAYVARDGKLSGRALLWETPDWRIMDRIYGSEKIIAGFIEWAKENNYGYKRNQDSCSNDFIMPDESIKYDFVFECDLDLDDGTPYMDTFIHYSTGGELNTYAEEDYVLQNCDGRAFGRPTMECYCCGCRVDEHEVMYMDDDPYCSDCVCHDSNDNLILQTEAVEVTRSGQRYPTVWHMDDCRRIRGEWYHQDDIEVCPNCSNELIPDDEYLTYIEVMGDDVCDDCIDDYMRDNNLEYNEDNEIVEIVAEVETV